MPDLVGGLALLDIDSGLAGFNLEALMESDSGAGGQFEPYRSLGPAGTRLAACQQDRQNQRNNQFEAHEILSS